MHYLRVKNNVNFETMGNAYFVEDGIETKNVITHNLGFPYIQAAPEGFDMWRVALSHCPPPAAL